MKARAYLELKLSWELFEKGPDALSEAERKRLEQVSRKQEDIERRILKSPEAAGAVVPGETLATRLGEIRRRYPGAGEFRQDLERLGLDEAELAQAVSRDLRIETVLERIAAAAPAVSEIDAEIFYRLNRAAFERPEARRLRHILLTFEGPRQKAAARQQLESLRSSAATPEAFAAAALRHSQCPTALQGGELGLVKRGDLYPELEPAAFALAEGEVSSVLESPVGLHLVRCDRVFAGGPMEFAAVKERIIEKLAGQRSSQVQRDWVRGLPA